MTPTIHTPRRVLIVQTAFIGDVILTLPLVQKVKTLFPTAEIGFMAIPAAENILETIPEIDNLLIYDKHGRQKGIGHFRYLTGKIRGMGFDLAIIPHRSLRSALIARTAGIDTRIGFNRSAGKFLFTHIVPYPTGVHEINRNLHLLAPLGVNPREKIFPNLHFTPEDIAIVEKWLKEGNGGEEDKLIAIAPGSVWATKRWLAEYYAQLADRLIKDGYQVVLIGGTEDKDVAKQVEEQSSASLKNAVGRFTLRQSAFLIRKSQLLVTNDSAPLHLGVAVRTPVVAIFGATVPALGFYPYGDEDAVVEMEGLECRPCGVHGGNKCPIGTFDCMKKIEPLRVYEVICQVLEKRSERSA